MKDATKGTLLIILAIGLWAKFVCFYLNEYKETDRIPHYFSYTVIDLQGDTITGNTWVPSATRDLQVKNVGGASCLVAVYGNQQDVILCDVKKILRFIRFANLNLVQ